MANKWPPLKFSSSGEASDDNVTERNSLRRRLPNQKFREAYRRRLLAIHRYSRHNHSYKTGDSTTTSSEGELTEGEATARRQRRRRRRRCKNLPLPLTKRAHARVIDEEEKDENNSWFHFTCRDVAFAVLSVILLVLFMETHLESWINGRPPYRFTCYLWGLIVCCALWWLLMMNDGCGRGGLDGDELRGADYQ